MSFKGHVGNTQLGLQRTVDLPQPLLAEVQLGLGTRQSQVVKQEKQPSTATVNQPRVSTITFWRQSASTAAALWPTITANGNPSNRLMPKTRRSPSSGEVRMNV